MFSCENCGNILFYARITDDGTGGFTEEVCPKCNHKNIYRWGKSIFNGDPIHEVEIYQAEHLLRQEEAMLKKTKYEIEKLKVKIDFIKNNPDKWNIKLVYRSRNGNEWCISYYNKEQDLVEVEYYFGS